MEDLRVFVLTEGGISWGFGHVTRMLSLCQAFSEFGISVRVLVRGDGSVSPLLRGVDFEIFDWLTDRDRTFHLIEGAHIVVVDSYRADEDFCRSVGLLAKVPAYYEDFRRIDYPSGVVVNGNIYAERLYSSGREGVLYLTGVRYTPLRRVFWSVPRKEIDEEVSSVLITFGGSDVRDLSLRVLELLVEKHPSLRKFLVVGGGFRDPERLKPLMDENTLLISSPDAGEMKRIMLASDIAISAGGQTLYELARVGVPTIGVVVAENQLGNVEGWSRAGFLLSAGRWDSSDLLENIHRLILHLKSRNIRRRMSEVGRRLIDGKGSLRIVGKLLEVLNEGAFSHQ